MRPLLILLTLALLGCAAPQHQIEALCAPKDAACAQSLHTAATLNAVQRVIPSDWR